MRSPKSPVPWLTTGKSDQRGSASAEVSATAPVDLADPALLSQSPDGLGGANVPVLRTLLPNAGRQPGLESRMPRSLDEDGNGSHGRRLP